MDEHQRQIDELMQRKDQSVARMGLNVLLGFEFLSFGIDRLVIKDPRYIEFMTWAHVYEIVIGLLAMTLSATSGPKWIFRLYLPTVIPLFLRHLFMHFGVIPVANPEFATLKSMLAASLMGVFIIVLTPQSRIRVPLFLTVFFSAAVTSVMWNSEDGRHAAIIGIVGFSAALAWKASQIGGRRKATAMEVKNRALIVEAERGRIQAEMELASAIQDSLRPPPSIASGELTADFYMLKHDSVGGDWFAAEDRGDGNLLVLVVDATGKGIQAALVIHAVQSLWTAARGDRRFDSRAWILRLNDVLVAMGQGSAHTVTLALAEINRERIVYWSAGHGPLYLLRPGDVAGRLTAHFATGGMLGIASSKELTLKSLVVPLDPTREEKIYLGTDGVLTGSMRRDTKTVELLEAHLASRGPAALADSGIDDDKALVRIQLAPRAASKTA